MKIKCKHKHLRKNMSIQQKAVLDNLDIMAGYCAKCKERFYENIPK